MEDVVKLIYGKEISENGIEATFKNNMEIVKKSKKETVKEIKKEYKDDVPFKYAMCLADTKLQFIKWSLMFKDGKEVRNSLPFLINEIRTIANELEEFINE